jgi:hypothetical protein
MYRIRCFYYVVMTHKDIRKLRINFTTVFYFVII